MCACTGHWKRVWACGKRGEAAGASVCNVGVVGSVCVCVWAKACVGGGAIANLCGRKLRLMVMKAMLLTNPHPELNTV